MPKDFFEQFGGRADTIQTSSDDFFRQFGGRADDSQYIKPQPTAAKAPIVNKPVVEQPVTQTKQPKAKTWFDNVKAYVIENSNQTNEQWKQMAQKALNDRAEYEQKHPIISEFQKTLQPGYAANVHKWEQEAKYGHRAPFKEKIATSLKMQRSDIAPMTNIALLPFGGEGAVWTAGKVLPVASKAKPVAEFVAKHPFIAKTIAGAPAASVEGAGFGLLDKALSDASGIETDYDYVDAAKMGALIGPAAHGGINTALAAGKGLSKTKPIQAISKAHDDLLNSDTALGNTLANIEGTISNALNLGSKNETVNKYKALDEAISRGNVPMNKQLTPEELELIKMEQNLTDEQAWQLKHMLDNGVNSPENVAGDLSHVKPETDNLTPKVEEPAVKTQPDMSGEVSEKPLLDNFQTEEQFEQLPKQPKQKVVEDNNYVIPKQEQTISENNYFKRTKSPSTQEALANYEKNTGKKVSTIEPEEAPVKPVKNKSAFPVTKENKKRAGMIVAKELKSSDLYVKRREHKLAEILNNPEMDKKVEKTIRRLMDLRPSSEVEQALNTIYRNAPQRHRDLIARNNMRGYKLNDVPVDNKPLVEPIMQNNAQTGKLTPENIETSVKSDAGMLKTDVDDKAVQTQIAHVQKERLERANSRFEHRVKERNEFLKDLPDDMKTRAKAHEDKWRAIRNNAKEIKEASSYLDENPEVGNYFTKEEKEILKDQSVVFVDSHRTTGEASADFEMAVIAFKDINGRVRTQEEINADIRHELQHLADFKALEKLDENSPVAKMLIEYDKRYAEARDVLIQGSPAETLIKEKIDILKNNGFGTTKISFDNLDHFKFVVNNVFGENTIEADIVCKHLEDWAYYWYHPFEARAYNATSNIKNKGDLINELEQFFSKYQEKLFTKDQLETFSTLERNAGREPRSNVRIQSENRSSINEQLGRNGGRASLSNNRNTIEGTGEPITNGLDNGRTGETTGSGTNRTIQTRPVSDMRDVPSGTSSTPEISPKVQQIYDYYKKLSPETEKLKIERGAITEEQAKNRLKQQGDGSGNGLYYKDYSEPTGEAEFIEWTKDYNERRDSKVGEFGIKEKDDTKKANLKGTIKDALQEKHTKFALDLVDKHFAKPIENGKVQPGYVGVNRALLGTAIGRKYGTSWYETMLKGGDAIDKAFNETQAKGWKEYAERNNKLDYQIPKQVFDKLFDGSGETVAEYWSRYGKTHTHKAIAKTAGALLDAYNNSFKRGVLTSLSFWANNRMGNQIMLAAKSNPIEHARSVFEAFEMKDSSVPIELVESSLLEAMNDFKARKTYTGWNAFDNMLNLFGGHEIKTETLKKMVQPSKPVGVKNYVKMNGETVLEGTELKGTWKSGVAEVGNKCIALPNKVFDKVCDKLMKFNEVFERFERKQAFAIQVNKAKKQIMKTTGQKMITTKEAIKHLEAHPEMMEVVIKNVEDVLGDYNKFNNTEKKIFKRIVPFYSWYRTITRHTLSIARENPTRLALIALEMQRINERGEDRKEWQKGAFDTRLFDGRTGRKILSNKTAQIPYNTFKELFEENAKGSISPAITKPIEAARGKKFFNDSEITSRRYKRVSKYNVNSKKYEADGYLDKKTGKKVKDLPLSARAGYLGKEALQTAYPILRSPLVKAESLIQGVGKAVKDGNFLEPDAIYDADFGGYYHNEHFYGKEKRYASGQMDQGFKTANRLGLSLQTQRPLNKQERAELNKKRKEKNKRFIDRFKNS